MAPCMGISSRAAKRAGPATTRALGLVALLCITVVAPSLAVIASPVDAAAPSTTTTTTGSVTSAAPVALSGTISYGFADSVAGSCPGCRTSESLNVIMTVAGAGISGSATSPGVNWDNPDVYHCVLASNTGSKCFWVPLTIETASVHYHFATEVAQNGCRTNASATGSYKAASTPSPLGLDVVFNPGPSGGTLSGPGPVPVGAFSLSSLPPAHSYRATGDVALQLAMTYTNRVRATACGIKMPANLWDLPVGFGGPYRRGETAITGAANYQGLGTPRLSWHLEVKETGLQITSPMTGATIALTDGHYFSPQPGPDQSAPPSRQLTVKGVDTSPGASVVHMGDISARVAPDGAWSLRVPVSRPGLKSLSANDNAGALTHEPITVIDLVIGPPAEGAVLPITAAPAMPSLGAVATVQGYPGSISAVTFNWSLSTRGEYRDRCGHDPNALCGQWYPYDNEVASGTTSGRAVWDGDFSGIEGGFGRMSVSADIPGVLDEPVQSEPRWIDITGTNPSIAEVKAYVSARDPANAPVEDEIFCHESTYTQFLPSPEPREPATTTVPHDVGPNPGPFRPLYGALFAGIGIAQKDPASFPGEQWDWHANVDAGIAVFQEDLAAAPGWRQAEQVRLTGDLAAVLEVVNQARTHRGMKPVRMTAAKVPPLSAAEVEREAIRLYNGEVEYHFNLQYIASANRLKVRTVGTARWVEGAGEWQGMAGWQAAGGPLVTRKWIPAEDPGYVTLVTACHL